MNFNMNLRKIYFDKIKSGEKIYEIRLNDEKRQQLSVGDSINFFNEENPPEQIETIIEELQIFDSFHKIATTIESSKIGFSNSTIDEIIKTYESIYSKEKEQKYKVLAIKISLK